MLNLHIRKAGEAVTLGRKRIPRIGTRTQIEVAAKERRRNVGLSIDRLVGSEVRGAQEISRNFRFSN